MISLNNAAPKLTIEEIASNFGLMISLNNAAPKLRPLADMQRQCLMISLNNAAPKQMRKILLRWMAI